MSQTHQPVLVAGSVVLVLAIVLPLLFNWRFLMTTLLLSLGFLIGFLVASPELQLFGFHWDKKRLKSLDASLGTPNLNQSKSQNQNKTQSLLLKPVQLDLDSRSLDQVLSEILDLFIRDFFVFWWQPLNKSQNQEFETQIRSSFCAVVMNMREYCRFIAHPERNMEFSTLLIYNLVHVLMVHLKEYRLFEQQQQTEHEDLEEYLKSRSSTDHHDNLFTVHNLSQRVLQDKLRGLSSILLMRLLPKQELTSPSLCAIARELLTTSGLWALVCSLATPDTLNYMIIVGLTAGLQSGDIRESEDGEKSTVVTPRRSMDISSDIHMNQQNSQWSSRRPSSNLGVDPSKLSISDVLVRNDLFALFMEHMESIKAPPFLRFWTNVDIYRQFALLAISESSGMDGVKIPGTEKDSQKRMKATKDMMRTDAYYVYEAHFGPKADLPIPVETASDVEDGIQLSNETGKTSVDQRLVLRLRNEIEANPNPDCFKNIQKEVLQILECKYFDGFRQSSQFRRYFKLPEVETREREPSIAPSKSESLDYLMDKNEETLMMHSDASHPSIAVSSDSPLVTVMQLDSQQGSRRRVSTLSVASDLHSESDIGEQCTLYDQIQRSRKTVGSESSLDSVFSSSSKTAEDDAMLHIAAAITTLREQLMLVENSIEQLRPSSSGLPLPKTVEAQNKIKRLNRTKKDIEGQIEQLLKMAAEMDDSIEENQEQSNFIDLNAVTIKMKAGEYMQNAASSSAVRHSGDSDATSVTTPTNTASSSTFPTIGKRITSIPGANFASSLMSPAVGFLTNSSNPASSLTARLKSQIFWIQVEQVSQSNSEQPAQSKGWFLSKHYSDFQQLHQQLEIQFSKVRKIPLPSPRSTRPSSANRIADTLQISSTQSVDSRLLQIMGELENYLRMLLVDQLIRESAPMQKFFRQSEDLDEADRVIAAQQKSKNTQAMKERVLSLLKTMPLVITPKKRNKSATREASVESQHETKSPDVIANVQITDIQDLNTPMPIPDCDEREEKEGKDEKAHQKPARRQEQLDLPLLIDTGFALITDIFELRKNHWLKRKTFSVARQILLTQVQVMAPVETFIRNWFSEDWTSFWTRQFKWVLDKFWPLPQRRWWTSISQPPPVTKEEAEQRRKEALSLLQDWASGGSLSTSSMDFMPGAASLFGGEAQNGSWANLQVYWYRIMGRTQTEKGISRLHEMLQHESLNRLLMVELLEVIVKLIFTEDRRIY